MVRKAIEYMQLKKVYRSEKSEIQALEDVTFDIHEREFVTVVGPSGCGKTTLLKITAGLLPKTGGDVLVNGVPVTAPTADVGIVFQTPVLLPWRRVLGNVMLPAETLGLDIEEHRKKAQDLLHIVGLEAFENAYPFELSGGMQQKVSISRAMVHDPAVLLMDEPFGALDALTREEMNLWLIDVWQKRKKTILFITHSIPEAVFLADFVVVMAPRPGKVVKIIDIDLPRPRKTEVEYTKEYVHYVETIRNLIFAMK